MTLEINEINDLDWDRIQLHSKHASIYTTSVYLNSVKIPHSKIVIKKNEQIIATVLINDDSPNLDYSLYQGISIIQLNSINQKINFTKEFAILKELIELLTKHFNNFTITLNYKFSDLRPFLWHNYNIENAKLFKLDLKYTGIINLIDYENFELYLNSIRSVRRQEYKKCISNKYNVIESNDLNDFLRLYNLTFERQLINVSNNEINNINNICHNLMKHDMAKLFYCANPDGVIVSSVVIFYFNKIMYYQFGATDPSYRNSGASVLLILNAIRIGFLNNYEYFDMVGINSPNRGDFKMSFNSVPHSFYNITW
jgi:hypothetical protein